MTTAVATGTKPVCPRAILGDEAVDALAAAIRTARPRIRTGLSERIAEQAVAVVVTSTLLGTPLTASQLVDLGLAIFRRSAAYDVLQRRIAACCEVPAGPEGLWAGGARMTQEETVAALREAGFTVPKYLWPAAFLRCTDRPAPGGRCA